MTILVGTPALLLVLLHLVGRSQGEGGLLLLLFPLAVTAIGLVLLPVSNGVRALLALIVVPLAFFAIVMITLGYACSVNGDCL